MKPKKDIYLICGVPGAGKTWVCKQLTDKFTYVPHDENIKDPIGGILKASEGTFRPIITECPFAERPMKDKLEMAGFHVIPYFVVEHPDVIYARFVARENKEPQKASMTRAVSIKERAKEWRAVHGTSKEILAHLQEVPV